VTAKPDEPSEASREVRRQLGKRLIDHVVRAMVWEKINLRAYKWRSFGRLAHG